MDYSFPQSKTPASPCHSERSEESLMVQPINTYAGLFWTFLTLFE